MEVGLQVPASPQGCRLQTGGTGYDCQLCSRAQKTALALLRRTASSVPGNVHFQESQGLLRMPLWTMEMVLMGGVFWLLIQHNSCSVASHGWTHAP